MSAFVLGWTKNWKNETLTEDRIFDHESADLFRTTIMAEIEGRAHEQENRKLASLFGEIVTPVKAFPTDNQGWIILDKHTKRLLHKDIKNENEVEALCKKNGYLR